MRMLTHHSRLYRQESRIFYTWNRWDTSCPTEVKVNPVSYDKTSLDLKYGAVVAELSGAGFTQVDV